MIMHADLCPVCGGSGRYKHIVDPMGMGYRETSAGTCSYETTCHGCGGKGWVVVPELDTTSISGYTASPFTETKVDAKEFSFKDFLNTNDEHIPHID